VFSSLQSRLLVLLSLLVIAAAAAGLLMLGLFRQSATARVERVNAELARACEAISSSYRFYQSGWKNTGSASQATFEAGLPTVVQAALRRQAGVEGGIWDAERGPLAYAYPTYEGSGPKTDLPAAERSRIEAINHIAARDERLTSQQYSSASQTQLLTACPLSGPIPNLTAWTMTRVTTFAGRAYAQLMTGIAVLLVSVVAAAALLLRLTLSWRDHIAIIRTQLAAGDAADMPVLRLTGERELDQIVSALNDALTRLARARQEAETLSSKVATAQRLAAIGRVTAGVAHEIRNPIAAMRLRAENALAKGPERYREALGAILEQIARLDRLLRRLLNVTEPEQAKLQPVLIAGLLQSCLDEVSELARSRQVRLKHSSSVTAAELDPQLMHLALENLLMNAIQASPADGLVEISAHTREGQLVLCVIDEGTGPPPEVRERLFEPFVTGRPDGTGLGLSIVREVAEAHRGSVSFRTAERRTVFEMILPWPTS
jgi:signal transduction histidine kinase